MKSSPFTRRDFLRTGSACAVAGILSHGPTSTAQSCPYFDTADAEHRNRPHCAADRLGIGAIGMRYQGSVIADKAREYGDIVAICDVDREVAEKARAQLGERAVLYEDYRRMLERPDVDVVTIGTPDHWHTAMVIAACQAGKDVYCEKPLTLTVQEGQWLSRVVRETGRIVQVGTWQRSDENFRLACEMVRQGRLGKITKVTVVLGKNQVGGPFQEQPVPQHLNWDLWQGQTPAVPYLPERCHYTFRWWYEYSGGQMTDWGAHHMDIAQWGIGMDQSGPVEIDGRAKFPNTPHGYNVAVDFQVRMQYANGVEIEVLDEGRNGVLFEGESGRIFVNRGSLSGKPVEELSDRPLGRDHYQLYPHDNHDRPPRTGKLDAIINHMGNFFDCVKSRQAPLADVVSQHRSVSACHLANISMRLGRPLRWDPDREVFLGDDEANRWLSREQRTPFNVTVT